MNDHGRAQRNTEWNDSSPCSYDFSWKVPPAFGDLSSTIGLFNFAVKGQSSDLTSPYFTW